MMKLKKYQLKNKIKKLKSTKLTYQTHNSNHKNEISS